jgi:quercetin dioxygenase-like cupin family protein
MKYLCLLILLLAFAFVPTGTLSQSNSPQSPVEIKGEAHHHPKFENEFVRVWDVTEPAGDATHWHVHRNDNVVVTLGEARLRIETAGAAPGESLWKFGEVKFGKATYVHRAMNVGVTPFHNFTIELLKSPAGPPAPSIPKEPIVRTPVLENERVRAFEVTLEPGQSTSMHTHVLPGLAIALTSGDIEVTTEGKNKPDRLNLPLGDLRWRAAAVTHTIKNVGKSPFSAVDIELK